MDEAGRVANDSYTVEMKDAVFTARFASRNKAPGTTQRQHEE